MRTNQEIRGRIELAERTLLTARLMMLQQSPNFVEVRKLVREALLELEKLEGPLYQRCML